VKLRHMLPDLNKFFTVFPDWQHSNAVFGALYRKYQLLIMNSIPKQLSLDRIIPSKSTWANAEATKPHQYLLLIGRELTKIIQLRESA